MFLDSLGVEYEYEPEGFEKNDVCYLPDFRVTCFGYGSPDGRPHDLYLEVKGKVDRDSADKIKLFTPWGDPDYCIADDPDWFPILVLGDIPFVDSDYDIFSIPTTINIGNGIRAFNMETISGRYAPALPAADDFGRFFIMPNYIPEDQEWLYGEIMPTVANAYRRAREARFEHGENG